MIAAIATSRPSLFLVVPGSRCIVLEAIALIWPTLRLMSSPTLDPCLSAHLDDRWEVRVWGKCD